MPRLSPDTVYYHNARKEHAWILRSEGASFSEIGRRLGITQFRAYELTRQKRTSRRSSLNTIRMRNFKHRRASGMGVFCVACDTVAVEALLERELLLENGRDHCRADVEKALAALITQLCDY